MMAERHCGMQQEVIQQSRLVSAKTNLVERRLLQRGNGLSIFGKKDTCRTRTHAETLFRETSTASEEAHS